MKFLIPIFSRYGSILIQFALVTLIARILPTHETGTYFFISGLVLSLYFFAGLGIPDGLVVSCPSASAKGRGMYARALIARGIRCSLASVIVISVAVGVAVAMYEGSTRIAVSTVIWLCGYCLVFIASQALIALDKIQWGSFIFYSAVNTCLCLTTIPYLLLASNPSLEMVLATNACAAAIAGVAAMLFVLREGGRHVSGTAEVSIAETWKSGALIASGRVVQAGIIWMPVWIAGFLLSKEDTAQIGLACRLLGIVGAVLAAIRFSIRPQIARLAAEGDWKMIERIDRKIAFWASVLAVAAMAATVVIGADVIALVFGEPYRAAAPLLLILLGASLAESIGGPVDEILKMSGNAQSVLVLQGISLGFMAAVGALLSLHEGVAGTAVAFAFSFVLLYGLQIALLYKRRGIFAFPKLPRGG